MKTAIVIVNWNSWQDSARCIEACLKLADFDGSIFVCDNGSTDGSVEHLRAWAAGRAKVEPDSTDPAIIEATTQSAARPLALVEGSEAELSRLLADHGAEQHRIYMIPVSRNGGFAAGNNVGLRVAFADPDIKLFWLLNADAVPQPTALAHLAAAFTDESLPQLAGSLLIEYWDTRKVQACGASFDRRRLAGRHLMEAQGIEELPDLPSEIEVDYPIGASMMLNRAFVGQLGMLDETYFIYYEEIDLACRLPNKPRIMTKSLVYHKGGKSTQAGRGTSDRSEFADYHFMRSRAAFGPRLGWKGRLAARLAVLLSLGKRLAVGRFDLARNIWRAHGEGVAARRASMQGSQASCQRAKKGN